jgi:hypothetical protein
MSATPNGSGGSRVVWNGYEPARDGADLPSVQEHASAAAVLLTEENQDWFGVMAAGSLKPTP